MTARRVLLWRHGRTAWNVEHRFQGQADTPLDDVGRSRAEVAAAMLATFAPVAVVSSDLIRAVDTARPLAGRLGLPVTVDPRLRERSLGRWEGLTRAEVARLYPQEYGDWLAGREDCQADSEPRSALADRAMAALADTVGETVVLVTHSATAIALTGRLLGLPMPAWRGVGPLANCHWSELRLDEHGWRLRSHNVGPAGPVVPGANGAAANGAFANGAFANGVVASGAGADGAGAGGIGVDGVSAEGLAPDVEALDAGPAGAPTH